MRLFPRALLTVAVLLAAAAGPLPAALAASHSVPNDPLLATQWFYDQSGDIDIDATTAWKQRKSCSTVAIVDTGADLKHPDLAPNLWTNPKEVQNGKDDDGNGYVDDLHGIDVRTGTAPIDTNGHGTHVAGLVGARGDNSIGGTGTCQRTKLMIVKFMSVLGQGSSSAAAQGIRYAARMGARIINCSFGSSTPDPVLRDAIKYAGKKGALVVVAAGNDGVNIDERPSYPASWNDKNLLVVAATDQQGKLTSFSNYGAGAVDIAAPGADMNSTFLRGRYRAMSGTSMAAPVVAGAAAMVRREDSSRSPSQIKSLLRKQIDRDGALKGKVVAGGRLNLRKAQAAAD